MYYPGGPKRPEDMYPPGGGPPPGGADVYSTMNSASPFGFAGGQQPPYPPQYGGPQPGYPAPPPQGGYVYGGYPPPQEGYPPSGGYPPPAPGYPTGGYYGPPPTQAIPMQDSGMYRQGRGPSDLEYGNGEGYSGFSDAEVRKGFVSKVYTILSVQLGITALIIYPFCYVEKVQEFGDKNPWLMFVSMIIYMVIMFSMTCCEGPRRSFPLNMILLIVLTIAMGIMCGFISSRYKSEVVLLAFGMTAMICLIVTLIACFAPIDITGCGLLMCGLAVVLMVFGLISTVCVIFFKLKIMTLIYSGLAVVAFSVFLMFDTQQIMGGKKVEMSPEEYVFGALQLYVDIVQIFLNLLPLIAACLSNDD